MKKNNLIIGEIAGLVGVMISKFFRETYGDDVNTIIIKLGVTSMIVGVIYKVHNRAYYEAFVLVLVVGLGVSVLLGEALDNVWIILFGIISFFILLIITIIFRKRYYRD